LAIALRTTVSKSATVLGLLLVIAVGGIILNIHLQKALTSAQEAEQGKTDKLWQSLVERTAAKRSSGRVGQRFESLKTIREAAKWGHGRSMVEGGLRATSSTCRRSPVGATPSRAKSL